MMFERFSLSSVFFKLFRLLRLNTFRALAGGLGILALLLSGVFGLFNVIPDVFGAPQSATFTLDNVTVSVQSPFLPTQSFSVAKPGMPSQIASSVTWSPFRELSVTAIPFGQRSATELGIMAGPGAATTFRSSLSAYRQGQHALQQAGPNATLFGKQVSSNTSLVTLKLDSVHSVRTLIVEWITEAGNRLWLIRIAQEESAGARDLKSVAPLLSSLGSLRLTSSSLAKPSSPHAVVTQPIVVPPPASDANRSRLARQGIASLPAPAWWNTAMCDSSIVRDSHPLGANYRGVLACGPGGNYVRTTKFPGAKQPYEWQSSELAFRYLNMAYQVPSFDADANTIVANYAGSSALTKVSNGTKGQAPKPGDVISFGLTSTAGHVAVVTASAVNKNGDGTITVMEQNGDPSGAETLQVRNWQVQSNELGVWASGWLTSSSHPAASTLAPSVVTGNLLPWPGGQARYVEQGNNGTLPGGGTGGDHTGQSANAWDFSIHGSSASWPIVAARAGTVSIIYEETQGSCYPDNSPACLNSGNRVVISHSDGTQDLYLHVAYHSVTKYVSQNQSVSQGQTIADAGTTGYSSGVHLHFMVEQQCGIWWCDSMPASFSDVSGGNPLAGSTYTSGNNGGGGGGNCTSAPNLSSPNDGQTLNNRSVTFVWNPPSGCSLGSNDGYTLHINTSSDPEAQPILKDTGVGSNNGGSVSYSFTFSSDGTYYWHVRTCKPCTPYTPGAWANRRLVINTNQGGPPGSPSLQSPGNGSALNNRTVTFSWSPPNSPNLNGYTLHVSTTSTVDGGGANLIVDTGVGGTSYTTTFNQDYGTLWWSVAAWNTSGQRSGFASAWTIGIDTVAPVAHWVTPVGDYQAYHCQDGQTVPLEVSASDNVGVQKVHFLILLRTSGQWVDLGYDFTAPYQSSVACSSLDFDLNQVDGCAHDTAGNVSDCQVFWLYRDRPDTQSPTVNWVAPVGNTQVAYCQTQTVQLQADASDNVGVTRVHFDRWDAVALQVVDLGDAYSAPYQGSVGCTTLNFEWNQVDVTAYDAAGNSAGQYFWLSRDHTPLAPSNLAAQPATCSQIALTWNDNSDNEGGFRIYRDGAPIGEVGANVNTYQDGSVSGASTYTYTVSAFVGTLESSLSASAAATTPGCATNDDFSNAAPLATPPNHGSADTSSATTANDDPSSCGAGVNSHSVWYIYTPHLSRTTYLKTLGSNYDTVVAVWVNTRGNLYLLACNDDADGSLTSRLSFLALNGATYYIEVMSFANGPGGTLVLDTSDTLPIRPRVSP
ncbi:MAG TPA: peptidoglycan DD-metalloendopeptidase family protein [Ktedonobacterales bacterium]